MAGDWIKMRASLCTHPKVLRIAASIGDSVAIGKRLSTGFNGTLHEIVSRDVTRDITLSSLMRVWCAANEHTEDGVWRNADLEMLDQIAGLPGFGQAMVDAEWAVYDDEKQVVTFPNFLENNAPAKNGGRSSAAERQRKYRERKNAERDASRNVTRDVTVTGREEKRRVIPPTPASGGFVRFWDAWPKSSRKGGKAQCLAKWSKENLEPFADAIVAHVEMMKLSLDWRKESGAFIPAPLVYLNGKRWDGAELPEAQPRKVAM